MADFEDRLYKELQTVEQFRFKFSMAKIAFVTGLLGIGSVKLTTSGIDASRVLYLAPLVAVLFDILGMAATVSIYRIDAFLRVSGKQTNEDFCEKAWQVFLKDHRSSFSFWAATGFTAITFLPSVYELFRTRYSDLLTSYGFIARILWLVGIGLLWVFFRWWEKKIKHNLGCIDDIDHKCTYGLGWLVDSARHKKTGEP